MSDFDGTEIRYAEPQKRWLFPGIFAGDTGSGYVKLGMPDQNGIVEITYPNGDTALFQGIEA